MCPSLGALPRHPCTPLPTKVAGLEALFRIFGVHPNVFNHSRGRGGLDCFMSCFAQLPLASLCQASCIVLSLIFDPGLGPVNLIIVVIHVQLGSVSGNAAVMLGAPGSSHFY